jgi:hypothetical protein
MDNERGGHGVCLGNPHDLEEPVKHRAAPTILALALLVALPVAAGAQFTSFVAPPRRGPVDTAKQGIVARSATRDSVARMSLTDMKAWVDSAAGIGAADQAEVPDSAAVPSPVSMSPAAAPPQRPSTTVFSEGAIAPNTASPLPALVTGGLAAFFAGIVLLRLRPRRA